MIVIKSPALPRALRLPPAAEHSPATRTEGIAISHHAGGDCPLVRNVVAAQPPGFILARSPLLRRPLREGGRRHNCSHQREDDRYGEAEAPEYGR